MIITYQGVESVKIQFGDTVVSYNPVSKDSSFKATRFGADIALISINDPDMNGAESASRGEKEAFVINGPGEYEIGGIFIRGFPSKSGYKEKDRQNTIYLMNLEGMNLCFLGALGSVDSIGSETKEELDDIDILFVPIGGDGVLKPADAYNIGVKLEPCLIVPMHYGEELGKGALKTFLKEAGEEDVKPVDKLTIKKKDLEGKEGEVVVLSEV
jgi:L-ascorbate metabolism protein UlaG (beta-lactamase superfamily)